MTEIIQIIGRATRDTPGKIKARFTNLIAEPDASESAVTEAVNDTLKAIAASLLMEQVLAPRFDFRPKRSQNQAQEGFDYGEGGYDSEKCNVGVNPTTGAIQIEIKGLAEPKSPEAERICREDLNEVITAFVQDKRTLERGLFDEELVPEELTQVWMGKIVRDKFPNLDEEDQEAVRQQAVAALNMIQQAKKEITQPGNDGEPSRNTALINGVRRFAPSVTESDIDLIDRINPFSEAYAILAKSMTEERLKQVAEVIVGKRSTLTLDEARDLAKRALRFKAEKGRLPSLTPQIHGKNAWQKASLACNVRPRRNGMAERVTDEDFDLLDELGVETTAASAGGHTPREQRIITGFEEIMRFYDEHGRAPANDPDADIFEKIYAVRLGQIRLSLECLELVRGMDSNGLLKIPRVSLMVREESAADDAELLAELGIRDEPMQGDLMRLTHVRSREEIRAAEEIAKRTPCSDFKSFQSIFKQVQIDIESGARTTVKFQENAGVIEGELFILHGQKVYVAKVGEKETNSNGRPDCRLRLIYDNGTEGDLLLRSFQHALYKHKASRRITMPDHGPLFSQTKDENDSRSGFIYLLRSCSDHPFISANREVIHKIGVTSGEVKRRIANAKKDSTFLFADVEVVEIYEIANLNCSRLERLLHRFFAPARLDLQLKDRFGSGVEPQEWFLALLAVIRESIEKLVDGSIGNFRYEPRAAEIMKIQLPPMV